jgi:transcriptional regulator with XRE-family HTH domain
MTQHEVSVLSGVTLKSLSELERGQTRDPHTSSLVALSKALGVSVQDLLEGPVPETATEAEPAGKVEAPRTSGTRGLSGEGEAGTSLLQKALDAPRLEEEKNAKALNRLSASQGMLGSTGAVGFPSDALRIELREHYGASDALFDEIIWPLAELAGEGAQFTKLFSGTLSDVLGDAKADAVANASEAPEKNGG